MFQTDELVKIINQLQHADGMGYFETLGLILKLLGLCSRVRLQGIKQRIS
jgi:hypothetical protein